MSALEVIPTGEEKVQKVLQNFLGLQSWPTDDIGYKKRFANATGDGCGLSPIPLD